MRRWYDVNNMSICVCVIFLSIKMWMCVCAMDVLLSYNVSEQSLVKSFANCNTSLTDTQLYKPINFSTWQSFSTLSTSNNNIHIHREREREKKIQATKTTHTHKYGCSNKLQQWQRRSIVCCGCVYVRTWLKSNWPLYYIYLSIYYLCKRCKSLYHPIRVLYLYILVLWVYTVCLSKLSFQIDR